jgi:AcrR family transcriptional regulator
MKTKLTKEVILNAAFNVVKKSGMKSLSARSVANELKSSTQPVYTAFGNMKSLEAEIVNKAIKYVADKYLLSPNSKNSFLRMGFGYLRLAMEERELFILLYTSGNRIINFEKDEYPIEINLLINNMKKTKELAELNENQLKNVLKNMWIYVHGLASLIISDPKGMTTKFLLQSLSSMGMAVIEYERRKK